MKENLVFLPFVFHGTAVGGSVVYVTPFPLEFHSGAIWTENGDAGAGGTVNVRYDGTAQGTATLTTISASNGSAYIGTAATGAGTMLHIPRNGTIVIAGTAFVETILSGYAAFNIAEFGGTAYPTAT